MTSSAIQQPSTTSTLLNWLTAKDQATKDKHLALLKSQVTAHVGNVLQQAGAAISKHASGTAAIQSPTASNGAINKYYLSPTSSQHPIPPPDIDSHYVENDQQYNRSWFAPRHNSTNYYMQPDDIATPYIRDNKYRLSPRQRLHEWTNYHSRSQPEDMELPYAEDNNLWVGNQMSLKPARYNASNYHHMVVPDNMEFSYPEDGKLY